MKKGSSLLLVVIVIASLIVVVFGANRLSLVQFNQAVRDEDNIFALYAAKAGIEDGLLRFRYSRDAETSENKVFRFDLTNGKQIGGGEVEEKSITTVNGYSPTHQYYDMKLNFRDSQIGELVSNTVNNPLLTKDDSIELTGFPQDWPRIYYLRFRFDFTDCDINVPDSNRLVQIQQIGDPIKYEQRTVKKAGADYVDSAVSGGGNLYIRSDPSGSSQSLTSSIRIRAYGCSIRYAFATSESSGSGGIPGPKFDSLKSIITSTGYYGSTKRTLIAEINRSSGQLIGIYDFNVYAGTGNIKP